ncbi:7568_t:CDS:2, partial [Funneliformis geosporum]
RLMNSFKEKLTEDDYEELVNFLEAHEEFIKTGNEYAKKQIEKIKKRLLKNEEIGEEDLTRLSQIQTELINLKKELEEKIETAIESEKTKHQCGKIEANETPLEAAKREVFEETNLIIENLEIVGEQAFDKKNRCMGYLVKANKYSGEIKIKEVEKIAEIKFKQIDYEFAINRLFYAIIFEVD